MKNLSTKVGRDAMNAAARKREHERAMKRRGRPPLPAGMKVDKIIVFGLNASQAANVRDRAMAENIGANALCKRIVLEDIGGIVKR